MKEEITEEEKINQKEFEQEVKRDLSYKKEVENANRNI